MTVRELIIELKEMPQHIQVYARISQKDVWLVEEAEWDHGLDQEGAPMQAVILLLTDGVTD